MSSTPIPFDDFLLGSGSGQGATLWVDLSTTLPDLSNPDQVRGSHRCTGWCVYMYTGGGGIWEGGGGWPLDYIQVPVVDTGFEKGGGALTQHFKINRFWPELYIKKS